MLSSGVDYNGDLGAHVLSTAIYTDDRGKWRDACRKYDRIKIYKYIQLYVFIIINCKILLKYYGRLPLFVPLNCIQPHPNLIAGNPINDPARSLIVPSDEMPYKPRPAKHE